jgi:hypothetical protein
MIGDVEGISWSVVVGLGLVSSSACSAIVSETLSEREPRFGNAGSSNVFRRGLCRLPDGPRGLDGLPGLLAKTCRPLESSPGEECARVMRGAPRDAADRERRWVRENGERFRGRVGSVEENGKAIVVSSSCPSALRRVVLVPLDSLSESSGGLGGSMISSGASVEVHMADQQPSGKTEGGGVGG